MTPKQRQACDRVFTDATWMYWEGGNAFSDLRIAAQVVKEQEARIENLERWVKAYRERDARNKEQPCK